MSETLEIHPARIKPRDIAHIVETLRRGGVAIASLTATIPSPFSAPT